MISVDQDIERDSVTVIRHNSLTAPTIFPAPSMAPKQPCAKYTYVVTAAGPKILPVDEPCKDEESPADYNSGGYLQVKVNDTFHAGRYRVVRKLGCVVNTCRSAGFNSVAGAIFPPSGSSRTTSKCSHLVPIAP